MTDTYLIAGGGTGGHIFPALAIARAVAEKKPHCRIVFAGTRYGMERTLVPKNGFPLLTLPMRGLLGKSVAEKLALMWRLPASLLLSVWYLMKLRPRVLVGVGGYASLPMLLVGACLRFPTMIQEQNAYPGITNRLLSRFSKIACLGFPQAASKLRCPSVVTGNPVRRAFFQIPEWDVNRSTILVLGGSQGARILNEHIPRLLSQALEGTQGLEVVHQAGAASVEAVRERYGDAPVRVEVAGFIDDVPAMLSRARVVICRAGASTVSELIAARVPAIFVPFSKATHDHQTHNAMSLVDRGCACLVTEQELPDSRALFESLFSDREKLERMAQAFDSSAQDGAAMCADIIEALERKIPVAEIIKEKHGYVSKD